jgi:hypothetical protein
MKVKEVASAIGIQRINNRDGRPEIGEALCKPASDKTCPSRDQDRFVAIKAFNRR